jgi:NodT family efflux transporter outer membrane factor (OMF) lipoprotein
MLAAALLAGGCTKVGPDFVKPEAQVAKQWIEKDDPRIDTAPAEHGAWWKVFGDPVLDRLVETAYRQNLSLRIAGIRILEARAQLGIAVGNTYPQQQSAVGGATYTNTSKNLANTATGDLSYWDFGAGFDAGWELDFWGKFRRGIESADANLYASVANYDDILVSLTAEVANTYVLIRTTEERLTLARSNVDVQERSLRITDVRFRNGVTTELDVQQAKSLLYNTQASIPRFETRRRQAQHALSTLLGMPPGELQQILDGPGTIPKAPAEVAVGIPAELLRRRPDVRRVELETATQSALIGVAQGDLYPHFSLFGTIGLAASDGTGTTRTGNSGIGELFDSDSLFFTGGPSVTWDIFNYGRIKNSVRVQDARLQQLIVNYENTVLGAAREVEDAMVGFLRTQEEVGFLADGEKAAKRSVDLALVQYRDGTADYTRVLDTQEALVLQQDELTAARGEIARNLIAMYKALGGGWEIRRGNDFVPAETKKTMGERTDWGELLGPEAMDVPKPGEASETFRRPDW